MGLKFAVPKVALVPNDRVENYRKVIMKASSSLQLVRADYCPLISYFTTNHAMKIVM